MSFLYVLDVAKKLPVRLPFLLGTMKSESNESGQIMAAHFKGKVKDWRSSFLLEYYSDTVFPRMLNMGYKAVRNQRYKYIHYVDLEGMNELYDLAEDPVSSYNAGLSSLTA